MPRSQPPFRITLKSDGTYILDCPDAETEEQIRQGFRLQVTRNLEGQIIALDLHLEPKAVEGDQGGA